MILDWRLAAPAQVLGVAAAVSRFLVSRPADATLPRSRVNNFDGVRLLAALLVVYGHVTHDTTGTDGLRVLLFFAVSGFLIAGSWNSDPHAGRFLWRRFLRVWPAFAVMVLACSVVSAVFPAPDMPEISRLASTFYLSNLWFSGFDWGFFPFAGPFMNRSIWMLPFEVNLYLALALIGFLDRRLVTAVAGIVLIATPWAAPMTPVFSSLQDSWSLYFAGFFCFGILLRQFPSLRRTAVVAPVLLAGALLLSLGHRTVGLLCVIPMAAVWIGERSWPLLRSAARFGDLSLGIFLWGWPVHQVTRLWMAPDASAMLYLVAVLAQAAALAWLSWHLIESPAMRWRPGKPSTKMSPVPDGGPGVALVGVAAQSA